MAGHVLLQLIIFKTKQKSLRKIFYLQLNIAGGNVPYLPLPGPNHLQNLTVKCNVLKVFWTYIVRKRKIEQVNVFNWLSNVKNVVFSNGSKHVRNVIQ